MLGRKAVKGFSYSGQVHRKSEESSPSSSAQKCPAKGRLVGLSSLLLQILSFHEGQENSS